MGDDFTALGFKMDSGNAFSGIYGDAAYDYENLDKIIDDVNALVLHKNSFTREIMLLIKSHVALSIFLDLFHQILLSLKGFS